MGKDLWRVVYLRKAETIPCSLGSHIYADIHVKSAASTRSADTAAQADHENYEACKTVGYRRITMTFEYMQDYWVNQLQSVTDADLTNKQANRECSQNFVLLSGKILSKL